MYSQEFVEQVKLLLRCLPAIREQSDFAIKGGTAINLLIRNLPRLSVDIDLTYCHLSDRDTSLLAMQDGLRAIACRIKKMIPTCIIKEKLNKQGDLITKLFVYNNNTIIKIEPNFIVRGTLYPVEFGSLCAKVNEEFDAFLDRIPMLSKAEVYAGKICAALSRQHPRDLFDIKLLLDDGDITTEIRQAFVVYIAGDARPIHELLAPNRLDMSAIFEKEFLRMVDIKITLGDLINVREKLIAHLHSSLTENERQFLFSIKEGSPQYDLMPFDHLDQLPSLRWKLMNIQRMDKKKHIEMLKKLESTLMV